MKLCLRCNQYFEDGIELCPIDTSQLEAVGDHPLIGALINDRYVVDSVIGKGSTGIVYKATRLLMGSEVAVKVLHSYLGAEAGALDRFLREARAASRLRHPHIINIWEFGATDDGQPYFVMDYLEGMTLADLIKQKGVLHPMKMLPIIKQVCEALAEAHKQNIIHRDIKPENIVLQETDYANGQDFVKVLDFGIADQPATGGQKRSKMAAGSPAYMSPEQCQGFELDFRTDIYSLAIVIFEMLTGTRPFTADDVMNLFYQHVSKAPPSMGSIRPDLKISAQLEQVVLKALSKKPQQRQSSIKELQKELEEACKAHDPKRKNDTFSFELYALPSDDRLTTGDGPAKRKGNFLPGPEELLLEEAGGNDRLVPGASMSAPSPGSETADHNPLPAKSASAQPDYQEAVNRLLKSAKRASETPSVQGQPAIPAAEPPQGTNDVSNWAREVLTRSGDKKPVEPGNANPPPKETFKSTTRSSGSHPAAPANNEPPKQSTNKANADADARARAPEAPEVSSWAQRVLSRSAEQKQASAENKPAEADMPPTLDPTSSSTEQVPPPAVQEKGLEPASGAPMKPSDFLKSKSKEAAQMKAQSESQTNKAVPSEPAAVAQNSIPGPAPLSAFPPAAELPAANFPVPEWSATESGPIEFQPTTSPAAVPTVADPYQSLGIPIVEPAPAQQAAPVNQASFDTTPTPAQPVTPAPAPQAVPAAETKAPLKNSEPPTAAKSPAKVSSIESMLSEVEAISAAKAAGAPPPPKPVPPAEKPGAKMKKTGGFALAAEKLMGAINRDKHPAEPAAPKSKDMPLETAASAAPPKTNNKNNNTPAPAIDGSHPNAADAELEEMHRRFEEPVNKGNEQLSSFANAVGALLDAAILPKKPSDTGRFTKSSETAPFIKSTETPSYTTPAQKAAEPVAKSPKPPGEPLSPASPQNKSTFDPKRFDEPVNKGNLGATRFDAEVNRALKPVSEHSLPALDPTTREPRMPAGGAVPPVPPPSEPRRVSLEERMAAAAAKAAEQGKKPSTSSSNLDARLAAADAAAAAKADAAEQAEKARLQEEAIKAEEARAAKAAEEARAADEERKVAEAKAQEAAQQAEETERLAAEQRRAEDERRATEEAEAAEQQRSAAEAARNAEEQRLAAEAETARVLAEKEATAAAEAEQARAAEEARMASEAEAARLAAEAAQALADAKAAADKTEFEPNAVPDAQSDTPKVIQPSSEEIDVTPPLTPAPSAMDPSSNIDTSPLNRSDLEMPSMGRSSSRSESRHDQAAKALDATTPDQLAASEIQKPSLDPKRFDQPVNQGKEKLNSLAQAVDGAMDAVMAKPAPHVTDVPVIGQTETGMIDSARLKAKVASLKAGLANPPSMLQQPPKPPSALTLPPASAPAPASQPEPAPTSADDKMSDAVTRLIEAAQKVPDAVTGSTSQAKPEALNRKIEAVKKKIEALKANQQGVTQESTMPTTPVAPPQTAPVPPMPSASAPAAPPAPPRSAPQTALPDPGSVSDAVNRLLEAAQSGVYPTVAKNNPKSSQTMRVSETGLNNVGRSGEQTGPQSTLPANFDPATNRAAAELAAMKAARGAEVTDYYAGFKQVEKMDKASLAEKRKQDRARLRTVKKGGLAVWAWALLALGAAGVLGYTLMPHPNATSTKASTKTADELIKNEEFADARILLEKRLKTQHKLSAADQSKLYQAYLGLGQQQIDEGDYETAVSTLRLIKIQPGSKAIYKQAKELIRQYKGKPNKLKKPEATSTAE